MVSRGVNSSHKIWYSHLRFAPLLLYDDFIWWLYSPPHLFAPPSIINRKLCQGTIYSFLQPPVSPGKPLCQAIHLPPGQTKSPQFHLHTNKQFLNYPFSKSLTNISSNLTQPSNQGINFRSLLKIVKRKTGFLWNPHPRDTLWKWCFSNSTPVSAVNIPNNMSIPYVWSTWGKLNMTQLLKLYNN